MMKQLLMITLIAASCMVHGQISLQPVVPAVGLMQKAQLWNVLAVNNSAETYNCRLDFVLTERSTSLEVFTAVTGNFTLASGAKQLNVNSLNPIQYNYMSGGSNTKSQTLMPAGSYTACYTLTALGTKETVLAEECVPFDVEALSPPMLTSPADSAQLEIAPTQFSWIPPTPAEMFNRLNYEILVTPINEGQDAAEAIEENMPFYSEANLQPNFLNYSSAYNSFEKNKWYAWQIVARDDKNYAAKSEIWVFKVPDTVVASPVSTSYISLNKGLDGQSISYIKGKELTIKYYCEGSDNKSAVSIYATDGKLIQREHRKMQYGDNVFYIRLNNKFPGNGMYLIEIAGENGKKYKTAFMLTL